MKGSEIKNEEEFRRCQARRLARSGVLLFLLGLVNGFIIHTASLPLLARSAHLLALMAGTWLIALGAVWPVLGLARFTSSAALGLALYSAFFGWLAYLVAALWGAGGMFPLASGSIRGTSAQEMVIQTAMITVALAFVTVCLMLLVGLRKRGRESWHSSIRQ